MSLGFACRAVQICHPLRLDWSFMIAFEAWGTPAVLFWMLSPVAGAPSVEHMLRGMAVQSGSRWRMPASYKEKVPGIVVMSTFHWRRRASGIHYRGRIHAFLLEAHPDA